MTETFRCDDKDTLVGYLYGEIDEQMRGEVEHHLRTCLSCAQEVEGLQAVRRDLQAWRAPEADLGFAVVSKSASVLTSTRWSVRSVPVWAQIAAAVFVLAIGAAVANVQVRYSNDGLMVSTGWLSPTPQPQPLQPVAPREEWRPVLTALEHDLQSVRAELTQVKQAAASAALANRTGASTVDSATLLRRVQTLIDESEQRQRQEIALRISQTRGEMDMQRRSDLLRINQDFGNLRGHQVKGQQEVMSLIRTVSTRQIP